jgi:hypothetical protein
MIVRAVFFFVVSFVTAAAPASAWWDGGHMQVAYVAYSALTPRAKATVDRLIKLNPDYLSWVAGVPEDKAAQTAFLRASTWADDIKAPDHGYIDDGDAPEASEDRQNIGYDDKRMHKFWHYKDIAFSTDGTPLVVEAPVDAVSQIKTFLSTIQNSSPTSDNIKSYDLVWLLHLVGDVHQPLHATTRVSAELPSGDRGGNLVQVRPATGETVSLHAYWDRMFGGYVTARGAIADATARDGLAQLAVDPSLAAILDPEVWIHESLEAAKTVAYAEPVLSSTGVIELSRAYETNARVTARDRAALAGRRLAGVINQAFDVAGDAAEPAKFVASADAYARLGCDPQRGPLYVDLSRPTNIDMFKRQLLHYRCTDYDREVTETLAVARKWVQSEASRATNPAIVLDIDETSVSNWLRIKMDDFGYIHGETCDEQRALDKNPPACGVEGYDRNADAPALKATLELFNLAKCNGQSPCTKIAVFFVTGRYDEGEQKHWTESLLKNAGYADWDGLYFRDPKTKGRPVSEHKIKAREDIEARGFTIIANIGDQESDLVGGHAERAFKVPNPFYFIP